MSSEAWKHLFEIIAIVLLGMTFVDGFMVWYFDGKVNAEQASQLKAFDKELTDAKTKLGEQQQRAAEAEKQLEGIRERQTPRTITDKQAAIIKSALASVRGQSVVVFTLVGQTEISNFADRLVIVLRDAGLMVGNRFGRIVNEPLPIGIRLSFGTNREALADLLHTAFTKATLGIEPLAAHREPDANALIITIGAKH
jgi:hypothetical protein